MKCSKNTSTRLKRRQLGNIIPHQWHKHCFNFHSKDRKKNQQQQTLFVYFKYERLVKIHVKQCFDKYDSTEFCCLFGSCIRHKSYCSVSFLKHVRTLRSVIEFWFQCFCVVSCCVSAAGLNHIDCSVDARRLRVCTVFALQYPIHIVRHHTLSLSFCWLSFYRSSKSFMYDRNAKAPPAPALPNSEE